MEEMKEDPVVHNESLKKDAPQLLALLREMKQGLDAVRNKVQVLTAKVKENNFPTAEGFSYLEAKHLLLLSYCQSIVYYLLRKAKGCSIEGHPVVRSLVEIRLFLEKVRPIDKKLDYQIQKLLRVAGDERATTTPDEKAPSASQSKDDLLKYRPNPDMLQNKFQQDGSGDGLYRPPRFEPAEMDENKMSKLEKEKERRAKLMNRKAMQSAHIKEVMDDHEGRPEELLTNPFGAESRELTRYKAKMAERERQEEEAFTRAPLTKKEKQRGKHLEKSRNGLMGLADGFEDEINTLGFEDDDGPAGFNNSGGRGKKFNKHKRKR